MTDRICFEVSFDQVTVSRGLHCKRHVKAACWQISQNASDPASVFEVLLVKSRTTAVDPHQKILDISSRSLYNDLFLQAEEGCSLRSHDRLSGLPLKALVCPWQELAPGPPSLRFGSSGCRSQPAVYSAAVTQRRREAEPGPSVDVLTSW